MNHDALKFLGLILGWFLCGGIFFRVWMLRGEAIEYHDGSWGISGWADNPHDPYYPLFWAVFISLALWFPLTVMITVRTLFMSLIKTTQFVFMPSKFRKPKEITPPPDPMMQIALREVNLIAPSDD